MLSAASRPYIDASVPVLREHGLAITTHFYREMFAARPELTQLFNMATRPTVRSSSRSPPPCSPTPPISTRRRPWARGRAHRAQARGSRPEAGALPDRRPHLLGAISAVLGDAATPDLLAAWDEAYWLLAGELIAAEARLYQSTGMAAGERIAVRVVRREVQSDNVVALTLSAVDGQPLPDFRPGQYISVEVTLDDGNRQQRQYSLSAERGLPTWQISVKREEGDHATPAGAVSNWLHANAQPGTELAVSAPFGDFAPRLDGHRPIVLLSAGIGITPMLSVLRTLAAQGSKREILFAHAARDGRHHAHRADLAWAKERLPQLRTHISYEQPQAADVAGRDYDHTGTMPVAALLDAPDNRLFIDGEFHLCGPLGFMQAQRHALISAGVPVAHIHREVFGPDLLDDLL